jgi:hypothetical protein
MSTAQMQAIGKIAGGIVFIVIGILALTNPPILGLDRVLAGGLIVAGANALGFNPGNIVAAPIARVAQIRDQGKSPAA